MRVLELFSGIGGMHYALRETCVGDVVTAVDINTVANNVYATNFPSTPLLQRNILSITANEINEMQVDMVLMSPPCQPFTRVGLKRDVNDNRTSPLLHFVKLLPDLNAKLSYILLENVKGFEESSARQLLVAALEQAKFIYQEFLLNPSDLYIPNSRTRYYITAKRKPLKFCFQVKSLMCELPVPIIKENSGHKDIIEKIRNLNFQHYYLASKETENNRTLSCYSLSNILENEKETDVSTFLLPDKVLEKYAWALDIVSPSSNHSCCFTKSYGHYVVGTGSILSTEHPETVAKVFEHITTLDHDSEDSLKSLKSLKLRYFTPDEILRLMCFPFAFTFPQNVTLKQKYRLLGNSINVHVVSVLIVLLTFGDF